MFENLAWDNAPTEEEFLWGQLVVMAYPEDTVEHDEIRDSLFHNKLLMQSVDFDRLKDELFMQGYFIVQSANGFALSNK